MVYSESFYFSAQICWSILFPFFPSPMSLLMLEKMICFFCYSRRNARHINLEIVSSNFSKTINVETEKIDYVQESCNIVFLCISLRSSLQLATQKSSGWRSTRRHLSKGKMPSCSCGWRRMEKKGGNKERNY